MFVLLDVQSNTDLVELMSLAKIKGIRCQIAAELEDITGFPKRRHVGKPKPLEMIVDERKIPIKKTLPSPGLKRDFDEFETDWNKRNALDNPFDSFSNKNKPPPKTTQRRRVLGKVPGRRALVDEERSACTVCGAKIGATSNHYMEYHCRTHFPAKGFQCSICDAKFAFGHIAKAHLKEHPIPGEVRDCLSVEEKLELEILQKKCFPNGMVPRIPKVSMDIMGSAQELARRSMEEHVKENASALAEYTPVSPFHISMSDDDDIEILP